MRTASRANVRNENIFIWGFVIVIIMVWPSKQKTFKAKDERV